MKTIFLVTSGEFSSYRVDCAWSTRELAESHAKVMGGAVEEFLVDPDQTPPWSVFSVEFYTVRTLRPGEAPIASRWEVRDAVRAAQLQGEVPADQLWVGHCRDVAHRFGDGTWVVTAKNEQDAIKIATDRRASALAAYAVLDGAMREKDEPGRWLEIKR